MEFNYYKKREIVVPHDEIIAHIERLAKQINHDYKDKELIIVPLLTSCIVFLVELLTRLTINVEVSLLKISTYTEYGEAKRNVKQISSDFKWEKLKDRDILILDDLIDSGDTLNYVTQKAGEYQPLSVKTIVLFEKDMKRPYAIQPDYVGKKIPNVWVTGFGMDYNHKYRNLRDLVALDDEDKQQ